MNLVRSPFDAAVNELRLRLREALEPLKALSSAKALPAAAALAARRDDELRRLTDLILAAGDLPRNTNADTRALHQVVVEAKALLTGREIAALEDLAEHEAELDRALATLGETPTGADDLIDAPAARALAAEIAETSRQVRAFLAEQAD